MTTKKFWCHYVGSDGNTPKRRSIELRNLADLIPAIGDNTTCETPLWYRDYDEDHIETFAQVSDSVAVSTLLMGIVKNDEVQMMQQSDEDLAAEGQRRLERHLDFHRDYTPEEVERERKFFTTEWVENSKNHRDRSIARLMQYKNYTGMLLGGAWIANATLRGYKEAGSGVWPVMEHLRSQALTERERREQERQEAARRAAEERARKEAEAKALEQERLTQEADKFRNGQSIAGSDVVELCRRHGIAIHLRTVHNLQQVVADINGKDETCHYYRQPRGKRRPQLDGCYKTAVELYNYLQNH